MVLDFYQQEASFDIQFSLIDYDGSYSYAKSIFVGLLNTILVSVIGIVFATLLGVIVGISRLSPNYLISKLLQNGYVRFFRNIPLLITNIFLVFCCIKSLTTSKKSINLFDVTYLNC